MTTDNPSAPLFDCELKSFESPEPPRDYLWMVLSFWGPGGSWSNRMETYDHTGAVREAERRAKSGHTHIYLARIPGNKQEGDAK